MPQLWGERCQRHHPGRAREEARAAAEAEWKKHQEVIDGMTPEQPGGLPCHETPPHARWPGWLGAYDAWARHGAWQSAGFWTGAVWRHKQLLEP